MDIEEKKGRPYKQIADDIIDIVSEVLGTVASPATLWTMVLLNCNGIGKGFNGYPVNP